MKKVFFILLILLIGTFAAMNVYTKACDNNPYAGKYVSENNSNIMLKLDSNNKCTMIYTLYKEAECTDGKYVIKDNKIDISFNSKEPNYCGVSNIKGEVDGSRIRIYGSAEHKYSTFLKE